MKIYTRNKRLSIITDIIIFLILLLFLIIIIKSINLNDLKNQPENMQSIFSTSTENSNTNDISIQNKIYVEKIRSKYNIDIEYDDNVKASIENVSATQLKDQNIINTNIGKIEDELKKYDNTLFTKLKANKKYAFTIILVDKFNDNNIALASRNNLDEYKIYISNYDSFSRALDHEMFHIIEYYILSFNKNAFDNWSTLNPKDFNYQSDIYKLDNKYVYTDTLSLKNSYFVSKYAKVSDKEDRAETFAELMSQKSKQLYFNDGENLYKKAEFLSEIISQNINFSDNSNLYWNRFLK